MTNKKKNTLWTIILIATAVFALASAAFLVASYISSIPPEPIPTEPPAPTEPVSYTIMDSFDALVNDDITEARSAVLDVKKVYWIPDDAEIVPLPNESCFGETSDPSSLQWLIDEAAEILDGQELIFNTDIDFYPGSVVSYYLDESIFTITWQQVIDYYAYTFTEVKVSHASQFRRYLAGNEYGSDYLYPVTRMCTMENAVVASSADYYRARGYGIVTYNGIVERTEFSDLMDTCFIDKNGDMILVPAGEILTMEEAQKFVDEHEIDFSLAFGPIIVKDGELCVPQTYVLGEINDKYARAALCQKDELHYVIVHANAKEGYVVAPTLRKFASCIDELKCQSAYTLDGGGTGTLSMQGKALNPVQGIGRWISDMIYFATAIPTPEEEIPEVTEP